MSAAELPVTQSHGPPLASSLNPLQVLETLRTTWQNIQLPATVNKDDKARVVNSLWIIYDHITTLHAKYE